MFEVDKSHNKIWEWGEGIRYQSTAGATHLLAVIQSQGPAERIGLRAFSAPTRRSDDQSANANIKRGKNVTGSLTLFL